jgi:hypothetical protein
MRGCALSLGVVVVLVLLFAIGAITQTSALMVAAFLLWTPGMVFAGWTLRGMRVSVAFDEDRA